MKTRLSAPRNQTCAILAQLIRKGASEREMPFNGFRSRLSELRRDHGLNIQVRTVEFTNQFGRDSHYNFHYLNEGQKEKAIELYNRLNK